MIIMKFGGSSLSEPDRVRRVCEIVAAAPDVCAVVCSAFGGATDALIDMSRQAAQRDDAYRTGLDAFQKRHEDAVTALITDEERAREARERITSIHADLVDVLHGLYLIRECSPRSLDYVMSFGERLSAYITSVALRDLRDDVAYLDARDVIRTDDHFGRAVVDRVRSDALIRDHFEAHSALQIVTGYIARSDQDQTTTLGRGGSDYTASLLGAALGCDEIQIWTDVSGVMTADPRKAPNAFVNAAITYEEAMELAHFGAKVIYPPTMVPAMEAGVPLVVKNTFEPEHAGTRIARTAPDLGRPVCGITAINRMALILLKGPQLIGIRGAAGRLFTALSQAEVNVVLISQASSEHSICVAVAPEDAQTAKAALDQAFAHEIRARAVDPVQIQTDLGAVAVVGGRMHRQTGLAGQVFHALGRQGVNVAAIAQGSSERNLSFVVAAEDVDPAIRAIHATFFEPSRTYVFLLGVGLIGRALLAQMAEHASNQLVLVAVANSRSMWVGADGVPFDEAADRLVEHGVARSDEGILNLLSQLDPERCVLVDCTAVETTTPLYEGFLVRGGHVATPNKKANTGSMAQYRRLQDLQRLKGARFYYEATAGAGLPVVQTLKNLVNTGDRLVKMEAMLSGTLSYLFNTFDEQTPFSETVRRAMDAGLTEPDPRDDLNGMDVARKLLLLARESGHDLELSDLEVENLTPEALREVSDVETFLARLAEADEAYEVRRRQAASRDCVLRYIATFENGIGRVALQEVGVEHPCFRVSGCDNLVAFTTHRYADTPLVVQGPGAGAEVTAAQVFAEILAIAKR